MGVNELTYSSRIDKIKAFNMGWVKRWGTFQLEGSDIFVYHFPELSIMQQWIVYHQCNRGDIVQYYKDDPEDRSAIGKKGKCKGCGEVLASPEVYIMMAKLSKNCAGGDENCQR